MATPSLKRKRDFQDIEYDTDDDFSPFVFGTCGLSMKRRRKNVKPPLPFPKIEKDLNQEFEKENDGGVEFTPWKPAYDIQPVFTPQPFKRNSKMRASIQRKVSISVMRKKMKQFQDYSLPFISDFEHLQKISSIAFSRRRCRARKGRDMM
ncbi:hypothetical protein KUTeg_004834 [Tegillarca granosa]|uniref:Uncharacterized protein n=1 Tax=Tegillarca granosa TaxID=220873 RepID=A0ABQ9FKX8_TEGGR|nr:hypothetical protein KUTeg_004834 [Tegillarca granosa]